MSSTLEHGTLEHRNRYEKKNIFFDNEFYLVKYNIRT